MISFSEYVSLGHPDKVADYISQYLLDRYIEHDPQTRYAVEVQIKDHAVTLGGEVSSRAFFTEGEIAKHVRDAVNEVGYNGVYASQWGHENTICGDILKVTSLIGQQSADIAQGLSGWGDQGIFFGMATPDESMGNMPLDHTLAKRLCKALYESGIGGLDIKTQIVTDDGFVVRVIVAIPLLDAHDTEAVREVIETVIPHQLGDYAVIINGTGRYVKHSSIADCGTTGRKLAVDFYGGNCRVGGGSPWTKDASKADLTLNLVARHTAKAYAKKEGHTCYASLACCIGRKEVDLLVQDDRGRVLAQGVRPLDPTEICQQYKLDTPLYASMCRWGLFGEYQTDKAWEIVL